jgi:1,4-alpha-glucan branching enzyme
MEKMNLFLVQQKITSVSEADLQAIRGRTLPLFAKLCIKIILVFKHVQSLTNLLHEDTQTHRLLKLYGKCAKIDLKKIEPEGLELPKTIEGRIDYAAARALIKSKRQKEQIQLFADIGSASMAEQSIHFKKSLVHCLKTVAAMSGISIREKKPLAYFRQLIVQLKTLTDDSGNNVIQQLEILLNIKKSFYHDLSVLNHAQTLIDEGTFELGPNKKRLETILQKYGFTPLAEESSEDLFQQITAAILVVEGKIKRIDRIFRSSEEKINDKLAIFETSTDRLTQEFSSKILDKPIHVTMVGVEYAGLVKEGGLAEALEGLSVGMKKQNPKNHVRLIFPKFNTLPPRVQEQLKAIPPREVLDSNGEKFTVQTIEVDGVECFFIEHPSFNLTQEKPSIYGPDALQVKTRFAKFSQLAADLLPQIGKTDIIHLHDWHSAGVALKYKKDHLQEWKEGKTPPIVFTFHNNSRIAQGRYFHELYNYEPTIQGLVDAGIASKNTNIFAETLQIADSVTTVSPTFALESQVVDTGEGVSFVTREAAEKGKLFGVINGSNPSRWDPSKDEQLTHWKDPETQQQIDLSFSPASPDLLEKRQLSKTQLAKWVGHHFPATPFVDTKPIVTFIGRFDSYQKGIDKLDEAIEATLANGGQFICMGSLEDPAAKKILDDLERKYAGKSVLFIRDYKDPNGRLHFQQGDKDRQGIGSIVRAASDFLFIPSKYEPCGLVQFEGWLFGSLALGSACGGLADTIIPPHVNPGKFNGFLFDRNSSGEKGVAATIQNAMQTWAGYSPETKGKIIARLMSDARKCSWTEASSGLSPVEKYRYVYENARKVAQIRARAVQKEQKKVDLLNLFRKVSSQQPKDAASIAEERYFTLYRNEKTSFEDLEKAFFQIPSKFRRQAPDPYIRDVKFSEYERFGAHFDGQKTHFTVYAPGASQVSVRLLDPERICPMAKAEDGTWAIDLDSIGEGTKYQYLVNGRPRIDPYGQQTLPSAVIGTPPCSVVQSASPYKWDDQKWMAQRTQNSGKPQPMSFFELYPSAWRKKDGHILSYRELAPQLVEHCKRIGYTHVELMGLLDHPSESSWGYQVSSFFAPNSRMGSPEDLKYLINYLHQNQIGVVLDFIPLHFCIDDYALNSFDGTNLFQPSLLSLLFSKKAFFLHWGTKFFDYSKKHVRDFLLSSAAFWIKEMHIDAMRVDAVHPILCSENLQSARLFLKEFNSVVHTHFPGIQTIAEDYSGGLQTTRLLAKDGLGFDMKWNVGWQSHSTNYFKCRLSERPNWYPRIIKAIEDDAAHPMIVAISHDEVKAEKFGPLLKITPGLTDEQQLPNLRAFLSYMYAIPGKKLLFMGVDTASEEPWDSLVSKERGVDDVSLPPQKAAIQGMLADLNHLYKNNRAFFEKDTNGKDLKWIEKEDPSGRIVAYRRTSVDGKQSFACIHNFTDTGVAEFTIPIPQPPPENLRIEEVFNSDDKKYHGSGAVNATIELVKDVTGRLYAYKIHVPPLATVIVHESG